LVTVIERDPIAAFAAIMIATDKDVELVTVADVTVIPDPENDTIAPGT
jgi:hypothetical protein